MVRRIKRQGNNGRKKDNAENTEKGIKNGRRTDRTTEITETDNNIDRMTERGRTEREKPAVELRKGEQRACPRRVAVSIVPMWRRVCALAAEGLWP